MPNKLLRVEVWPKPQPLEVDDKYVIDDCEYVSFINGETYGIPGGKDSTITTAIRDGYKVVFINTETVERLTIEQQED